MARCPRLPGLSGLMRPGLMARCPRLPGVLKPHEAWPHGQVRAPARPHRPHEAWPHGQVPTPATCALHSAPCREEPVLKAWVEMVRNMVRTYAFLEQTIKGRAEHRRKRRSLGEDVCGRLVFLKGQKRKERGRAEGTRRLPRTPVRRLRDYKGLITSIGEDVRSLLTQRGVLTQRGGRQGA